MENFACSSNGTLLFTMCFFTMNPQNLETDFINVSRLWFSCQFALDWRVRLSNQKERERECDDCQNGSSSQAESLHHLQTQTLSRDTAEDYLEPPWKPELYPAPPPDRPRPQFEVFLCPLLGPPCEGRMSDISMSSSLWVRTSF